MVKCKAAKVLHAGSKKRPRLVDVYAAMCSHPSCDSPAYEGIATETPLCERHIFEVYNATGCFVRAHNPRHDEYVLLPSEQQQIAGPCPACGLAGYLMRTITDIVRCMNASCYYEAHIVQFESVRRSLLFEMAGRRPVVYYIKFRDCVQIGTSRHLKSRWSGITATEMLYGIEFGDRRLEQRRHEKFACYRTYGEWFEDNQHIRAHINNVCAPASEVNAHGWLVTESRYEAVAGAYRGCCAGTEVGAP